MTTNLIDEAKHVLADFANSAGQQLGETPSAVQTALNAALPVILSRLIQRASEPGGTSSVMDLTAQVTMPDRTAGEVIEPVGGILAKFAAATDNTTGQFDHLLALGSDTVQRLFGSKAGAVVDALASHTGLVSTSASAVLSLAGTAMLGVLGRHMATDKDGPSGMDSLLNGQAGAVQQAMPAGLGALLATIPGVNMPVARVVTAPPLAAPATPLAGEPIRSEGQYGEHTDPVTDTPNRWLPWLLLALGVVGLFFVLRSYREAPPTGAPGVDSTASPVASATEKLNNGATAPGAVADSAGSAVAEGVADLGAFFKRKLPSGTELNIPENGVENKLVGFIEDDSKPVDKTTWFNFDRLLFDTGKATLQPKSQEQLGNIADVLKAYPNVAIKLGGYTDNTGVPQANQQLATDRANTVMAELVRLGIDPNRITAEGYGEQFPVAPNDTEAGRAQNRRIAIRVTRK